MAQASGLKTEWKKVLNILALSTQFVTKFLPCFRNPGVNDHERLLFALTNVQKLLGFSFSEDLRSLVYLFLYLFFLYFFISSLRVLDFLRSA